MLPLVSSITTTVIGCTLVVEDRHRLRLVVVEDLEVVLRQVRHQPLLASFTVATIGTTTPVPPLNIGCCCAARGDTTAQKSAASAEANTSYTGPGVSEIP